MTFTGTESHVFRLLICFGERHIQSAGRTEPSNIKGIISKAFAYFWSKNGVKRQATFNALRKTYITELTKNIGEKALLLKHGSIMTGVKQYLEQEALANATKDVRFLINIEG